MMFWSLETIDSRFSHKLIKVDALINLSTISQAKSNLLLYSLVKAHPLYVESFMSMHLNPFNCSSSKLYLMNF